MQPSLPVSEFPTFQRAQGEVLLTVRRRDERTVLSRLRQSGCLKARLPRVSDGAWTEAVMLNSSGGVAGGDTLSVDIQAEAGSQLTVTGQAAERFYRTLDGHPPAKVRTAIRVADGAAVEWLPQESILFDECALDRRLTVDLAEGGSFLGVEMLAFGRAASGETIKTARLKDIIEIRRQSTLLLYEAIQLSGAVENRLGRTAIGGNAVATVIYAAPQAVISLEHVRDALREHEADLGASAWDGLLVARFCAMNGRQLRHAVMAMLQAIRGAREMPRIWGF